MTPRSVVFAFFWLFRLSIGIPHPIQDADNNTKCEFALLPAGYLSVDKTVSVPGECMLVTCQPDLTITGLTCPTHFLFPGCHLTEADNYKEYPDCCPQVNCKLVDFAYASDGHYDEHYNRNYN